MLGVESAQRARRPAYSMLTHEKMKQLGLNDLRHWLEALEAYLAEKGHEPWKEA